MTDPEPLPPEHPLWQLPNVVITAHLASATESFWKRSTDLLAENLRRYLAGEPFLNPVDKGKGYCGVALPSRQPSIRAATVRERSQLHGKFSALFDRLLIPRLRSLQLCSGQAGQA